MVVIEPEPTQTQTPTEEEKQDSKFSNPSRKSKSPVDSSDDTATVGVSGYASDGFETASESEINDGDEHEQQQQNNQQQHEEQSVHVPPNEDELNQKGLAQANDAKLEGNKLFGGGQYEEALLKYDLALQVVPEIPSSAATRSACHANRAACFFKMEKYEDTIKECTKAVELNPTYLKALVRRGEAHEKLEHYEEAIADMTKVLEIDPSHDQARRAILRLKPLADEKREKMKEEMIERDVIWSSS
ncbi:unnamed protein product [Ilex paraguariensis]|uniref:Tetratricopeptide repeat protein 1 n=1 Tax=Ilex paraguariensis TaxID=185542 RepID=A0ABC8TI27_9AQUA